MSVNKKHILLIEFPKREPRPYYFFSNNDYWIRYCNQPKLCRGMFSTDEKEDIELFIGMLEEGFIDLPVGMNDGRHCIDNTALFHIFYFEEWREEMWMQPKAKYLKQVDDEEKNFWVNSSEFGIDNCNDKYIKNILQKFTEESIGNEEQFWNFIEKATSTKFENKILCKVNDGGVSQEVTSVVVLNDIRAKHKLLKKMPDDIDFENIEKTLEDFE